MLSFDPSAFRPSNVSFGIAQRSLAPGNVSISVVMIGQDNKNASGPSEQGKSRHSTIRSSRANGARSILATIQSLNIGENVLG
jgi:hypothetical protein